MTKSYWVLFVIVFFNCTELNGQVIFPQIENDLDTHLKNVNPVWTLFQIEDKQISFKNEVERIQCHFTEVINVLKNRNVDNLSKDQRIAREAIIDQLSEYMAQGNFPKNLHFNERTPVFKDQEHTSCAVAYLMEKSGHNELVEDIISNLNFSLIKDIAIEINGVDTWAKNSGLLLEELNLIQPSYPSYPREFNDWGNGGPVNGRINVMQSNTSNTILYVAGDFTEIDGQAANSIIAWNGEEWIEMGNGVTGEIHDIYITGWNFSSDNDKVYIVGNFILNDDPNYTNIAYYEDGEWVGMQQGNMQGSVYTINREAPYLLVGGDFLFIDNEPISYLALKKNNDNWSTSVPKFIDGDVIDVEGAFSVDGPVYSIEVPSFDRIIVGGEFGITSPQANPLHMNQIASPNLAFWQNGDWVEGPGGPYENVLDISFQYGKLYISDEKFKDGKFIPVVHKLCSGFWESWEMNHINNNEPTNNHVKFLNTEENSYAYGNLELYYEDIGQGFVQINSFDFDPAEQGGIRFDSTVHAAVLFQNNFYFAGDFRSVMSAGAGEFPSHESEGLVVTSRELVNLSTTVFLESNLFKVSCNNKTLKLEFSGNEVPVKFMLYDRNGRLIKSYSLGDGQAFMNYDLSSLNDGVYFYNIHFNKGVKGGKLSVF